MGKIGWRYLVIALLGALAIGATGAQQVEITKANRTIFVSAVGNASIEADAATVHIGYQVYGPDSETAYARGSKASNEIVAALTQAGVPKDAIESETQTIAEAQPYEQNNLTPAQRADRTFRLQQSWTVKTSAKDASHLLDIAVKAGANASGQIDWRMADTDALHAKAVEDAMARAKKNAESIATGMGVKLGVLIYAGNDRPPSFDRIQVYTQMGANATINGRAVDNKVLPLAVNARKIEDTATIYAVYAIE